MGKRMNLRIGATAGMVAGIYTAFKAFQSGGTQGVTQALTGWTGDRWDWKLASAAIPMVAGVGLSMVASKVGLNRYTPKGINI